MAQSLATRHDDEHNLLDAGLCQLRREDYTVGWVCALPVELAAALEMVDKEHGPPKRYDYDENLYYLGSIVGHNVVIVCLPAGRIGNNPAAAVATQMRATFKGIRFGLMVGIGGGVPNAAVDIRLGDVVVSQPDKTFAGVVQYDIGKTTLSGFERTGSLNSPPQILLAAVASVQANEFRGRSKLFEYIAEVERIPKFQRSRTGPDVLFNAAYDHEGGQTCDKCSTNRHEDRQPRESGEEVVVHYGTIASGNQVIKNAAQRDKVSIDLGGVLCFEMEAAGLINTFPCLVVRGICDYADSHKNKKWQPYAAGTAAAYAKEVLSVIPSADIAKARPMDETVKASNNLELHGIESHITATIRESGKLDLFISQSERIRTIWRDKGSEWTGVTSILSDIPWGARIAVAVSRLRNLDVFVCDMNGYIRTSSWTEWDIFKNPFHQWTAEKEIGCRFPGTANVSAISIEEDIIDVFVCGRDGLIYTTRWKTNELNWPKDKAWEQVLVDGGFPENAHVTVTNCLLHSQHLLSCDKNGVIKTTSRRGRRNWSSWKLLGDGFQPGLEIIAVSRSDKNLDIFACQDGRVLWRCWTESEDWRTSWEPIKAQFKSQRKIAVASPSPDELDIYTLGTDGFVRTARWTENFPEWSDWHKVGDKRFDGIFMDIIVTCLPYQALHLFLHTTNSQRKQEIWYTSGYSKKWKPWEDLHALLS